MMTDKEYVDISGSRCPFCGSEHIEADDADVDAFGAGVSIPVVCLDCKQRWTDDYVLTGFSQQ